MISRRRFCNPAGVGTASIGLLSVLRAKADLGPSVTGRSGKLESPS
jgi:hypothetical protein